MTHKRFRLISTAIILSFFIALSIFAATAARAQDNTRSQDTSGWLEPDEFASKAPANMPGGNASKENYTSSIEKAAAEREARIAESQARQAAPEATPEELEPIKAPAEESSAEVSQKKPGFANKIAETLGMKPGQKKQRPPKPKPAPPAKKGPGLATKLAQVLKMAPAPKEESIDAGEGSIVE